MSEMKLLWFSLLALVGGLFTALRPTDAVLCDVSLPQDTAMLSKCYLIRQTALKQKQNTFDLAPGTQDLPFALLDMKPIQLMKIIELDPFIRYYANKWLTMGGVGNLITKQYLRRFPNEIKNITQYEQISRFFEAAFQKTLGNDFRLPSPYEPVIGGKFSWLSDKLFAQQRLAGVNPMSIKQITIGTEIGLDWNELQHNHLNPQFDWEGAVKTVVGENLYMELAIENGYVFGLRYEDCDNLPTGPDLTDQDSRRVMWSFKSPIALFAVDPEKPEDGLKPFAIQMDHTPDSQVYTPADGDNWLLAKLNVQVTDLGYTQIVEHLAKVHFLMEPFCVCLKRTLSFLHPLNQILKYHCRELIIPNKFGIPVLQATVPQMFAYGLEGLGELLKRARPKTTWAVTDLRENIKSRGLDDKNLLQYFPYRDDGEEIFSAIQAMVQDFADLYYENDCDVKSDRELKNFLNEVSNDGSGKNGGIGQIVGLPPKITTKAELRDILSRMIWQLTGQHAAVNYLISDYAAFVPNNPTKLYNDTRVAPGEFNVYRLPNKLTAVTEINLSMTLASFRFDNLFDYGYELQDKKATRVVNKHYAKLLQDVSMTLEERNKKREQNNDLTYPYLLPQWLPNGIQS